MAIFNKKESDETDAIVRELLQDAAENKISPYYVRIGISHSLVQEELDGGHRIVTELLDAIEGLPFERLCANRLSFAVIRAHAETVAAIEEQIRAAWKKIRPDSPDDIDILATVSNDTEWSKCANTIYQVYYGAEPYQRLCRDIADMVPAYKLKDALPRYRKQNYLFVIDSGSGFSTLLSSYADFNDKLGVFDPVNGKNYEYRLGKESSNGATCADDVLSYLYEDDHKNTCIGLDICYFLDNDKTDELRVFINRLSRLQDSYLFLFRVPYLERDALENVRRILSDVIPVREVAIPPIDNLSLFEYFTSLMSNSGYEAGPETAAPFYDKIAAEKRDGRFYGFKTVDKIATEIAWAKAERDAETVRRGGTPDTEHILPEDIAGAVNAQQTEKSGYDELHELIGMEKIEARVREITAQVKLSMTDPKLDRPCIHMRFVGAPGTGKTTVARIIGKIFREEGILRKGAFFEYTARALCGEYVGQTAPRTAAICRDAYGSVLFIDEAYALYESAPDSKDYGKEALTTLISEMENHRDDMLVIMAGYTEDMDKLMQGNAGLRSRMPYMIEFPSYTKEQLFEIYMLMIRKHFDADKSFENAAKEYFQALSDSYVNSKEFANARFVRNLYERTWAKGALRAALEGKKKIDLSSADFAAASAEKEFSEKLMLDRKIGF